MPKPIRAGQRYMPGLDGLRALAVLAVICYHEQFSWAPGGMLGVGVFFTLSGYLITDLLLGQWAATGRLHLADFWLRRARRLLPALFVMLAVVTAWVTVADRARLPGLRGAVAAAATYSSNWYLIVANQSYFARFAPPQPLDHLWSLAVEEQFYLAWPWLLLLGLLVARSRWPGKLRRLALPTLALAAASAVAMAVLYQPGYDPTRVYEGTDTRAFGLLIGAALAMVWPSRDRSAAETRSRALLDGTGVAGLAVIAILIWRTGQFSPFTYRGGMLLLSVATAAVVAACACPGGLVGRALGWRPLRWIGVRSYGIYLWHYPVIVLTTPANATENPGRAALQIAASVALAALSWKYIEEPVRHGALARLWKRLLASRRRPRNADLAALGSATGVVALACIGLAGVLPEPAGAGNSSAMLASGSTQSSAYVWHAATAGSGTPGYAGSAGPRADPGSRPGGDDLRDGPGWPAAGPGPSPGPGRSARSGGPGGPGGSGTLRTSCRAVVHIGDSTSEGLISPDYLPDPADRITARYADVGVRTVITNITGARSVVEVLPGTVNGYDAAMTLYRQGFRGCWVIALGTNDTADIAAGSQVGLMTRVDRMMAAAHGEPVMWVNVISLLTSGPYAEANMQRWNTTLLRACARYPNMRVFDWAALAKRQWFISDGIHYTSAGYAARARDIADALARAFPASGPSPGCVVR